MTVSQDQDTSMASNSPAPLSDAEPKYGGFTRFEIELEVGSRYIYLAVIHPSTNIPS
jgi:hypothetical protein